jgi:hypothetical protein
VVALAAVLSLVLPGLGHVYLGRFGRALIWFGGALLVGGIANQEEAELWIGVALLAAVAVCSAFDAGMIVHADGRTRRR